MNTRGKINTYQLLRQNNVGLRLSIIIVLLVSVLPTALMAGLPSEFTSSVSDARALRILSSDPALVRELSPLFKNRQFSSSVKQLRPFQQRSMIKKAKKNETFRKALKSNHQKALPAAGIYSVSDSFTSKLIAAKKRGTVKIGKDGRVQGFRAGRKGRTPSGTRKRPALSTNGRKRPTLSSGTRRLSNGKTLSSSRKKPALSVSSRKKPLSPRKKPSLSASTKKRLSTSRTVTPRRKPAITKTTRKTPVSRKKPATSPKRTITGKSRPSSSGKKPVVSKKRPVTSTVKRPASSTAKRPAQQSTKRTSVKPSVRAVSPTRSKPSTSSTRSRPTSVSKTRTSVTPPKSRSTSSKTVKPSSLKTIPRSNTTLRK